MKLDDFTIEIDKSEFSTERPFWVYAPHIKGFVSRIDLINFMNRIQRLLNEEECKNGKQI